MSKFNILYKHIKKHKYLYTLVFFAAIIVVFDENSFLERIEMHKEISMLNHEIMIQRKNNKRDSLQLHRLNTDIEAVRKVAREQYHMIRDKEDLFIFIDTCERQK